MQEVNCEPWDRDAWAVECGHTHGPPGWCGVFPPQMGGKADVYSLANNLVSWVLAARARLAGLVIPVDNVHASYLATQLPQFLRLANRVYYISDGWVSYLI